MVGLAVQHGNLFDATVLTGASAFSGGLPAAFAAWDLKIASEIDAEKYRMFVDFSMTLLKLIPRYVFCRGLGLVLYAHSRCDK